jgi:hypothetical protein
MANLIDVTDDTGKSRPSRWRIYQRAKDYAVYDPRGNCRVMVPRLTVDGTRALSLAQRIANLMEEERR